MRRRVPLLTGLLPILAGCGGDAPTSSAVVRDSAGIEIVESPAPDVGVAFVVAGEPEVTIGALDGPVEYTFQGVRDLVRLADGRIVVGDGAEVRLYDAAGRHLRTSGGSGEGPGEFSFLASLVACGGEVLAGDMRQQYLTVFDTAGTFLRTWPTPASGNQFFAVNLDACDVTTGLPLLRAPQPFSPGDPEGVREGTTTILRLRADGGADTVAAVPVPVRTGGFPGPFDTSVRYAYGEGRVHVLDTGGLEVRSYDLEGALRRIARVPATPRPVTSEDQARAVEAVLEDMPAMMATQVRSQLESGTPPEHMPAAAAILADAAGRLWIRPFTPPWEEDASGWIVLGADGAYLGTTELPTGFRPYEIGEDWVLGVLQDELDVSYVRLYRFAPPDGGSG